MNLNNKYKLLRKERVEKLAFFMGKNAYKYVNVKKILQLIVKNTINILTTNYI